MSVGRERVQWTAAAGLCLLWLCLVIPGAHSVTYDEVSIVEGRQCYQFTWIIDANITDCDALEDDTMPCSQPFILTTPSNLPPNISDLNDYCSKGSCPEYICTDEKECLRWVKYDLQNDPIYMTLYCGSMVDMTKVAKSVKSPPVVYNKCFLNRNGTTTTEACTCSSKELCNTGARGTPPSVIGLILLAVTSMLMIK